MSVLKMFNNAQTQTKVQSAGGIKVSCKGRGRQNQAPSKPSPGREGGGGRGREGGRGEEVAWQVCYAVRKTKNCPKPNSMSES